MAEDGGDFKRLEEQSNESSKSWSEKENSDSETDVDEKVEETKEETKEKDNRERPRKGRKVFFDVSARKRSSGSQWLLNSQQEDLEDERTPRTLFDLYRWYLSFFYFLNIVGLLIVVIITRDMAAYSVRVAITGFAVDSEQETTRQSNWKDLWDNDMQILAFFQLIFVEIWTFLKVILLIVLWAYPMVHNRRAWLIYFVSGLAKWSFWTLFLVCFLVIAMYGDYTVVGYQIETQVNPEAACYMFALEVVWALGLAMFVQFLEDQRIPTEDKYSMLRACHLHQELLRRDNSKHAVGKGVTWRRLFAGGEGRVGFERPWDSYVAEKRRCEVALVQKLRPEIWIRLLFMLFLVTNCYMLVYSMTIPIVELDYKGVGGSLQDFPKTRYNLVKIGTNIRSDSSEESSEFLAFLFLFVNVFIPVFLSIIIVYVWFIKFSPITLIRMKGIVQLVQCWSALEVYSVLVGVITLNIERYTTFAVKNSIISEECDNLAKNHNDAQCLTTEGYILWDGMSIFILACTMHTCLVQFTIYKIRSNIKELMDIALGKGGNLQRPRGSKAYSSAPIRVHRLQTV